jgi:hypothetical protein
VHEGYFPFDFQQAGNWFTHNEWVAVFEREEGRS